MYDVQNSKLLEPVCLDLISFDIVCFSLIGQRFVKMAASMEDGVWLPTDVCAPTASPGPSVREVSERHPARLSISLAPSLHPTFLCALHSRLTSGGVVVKDTRAARVRTLPDGWWLGFFGGGVW